MVFAIQHICLNIKIITSILPQRFPYITYHNKIQNKFKLFIGLNTPHYSFQNSQPLTDHEKKI